MSEYKVSCVVLICLKCRWWDLKGARTTRDNSVELDLFAFGFFSLSLAPSHFWFLFLLVLVLVLFPIISSGSGSGSSSGLDHEIVTDGQTQQTSTTVPE